MGLRSLTYFLITAEEMHFTRAAERLYITQQSLSSHIQKLEEQYGVKLFERRPSLRLTLAGERMVAYAKRMLETEQQMNAEFADISEHKKGKLTLGITRFRGQVFMPAIWERYHKQYPNISLTLAEGITLESEELLQNGKIDLYIGVNAPRHPNTCRIELATDRLCCVISKELLLQKFPSSWEDFLLQHEHGIDLAELQGFPLIMLPRGNQLRTAVDQYFSINRISPEVIFETAQHDLIYRLAKAGSGVGIIFQTYLYNPPEFQNSDKECFVLPVLSLIPASTTDLVYRADYVLPQYAQAFIEVVKEVFQGYMNSVYYSR